MHSEPRNQENNCKVDISIYTSLINHLNGVNISFQKATDILKSKDSQLFTNKINKS